MAQLGVILKLAANIDPILYVLAAISVTYLALYGLFTWSRNHPDQRQRIINATGLPKLKAWLMDIWHSPREAVSTLRTKILGLRM
jgi:nicotinamide riboside transporter PnuC